MPEGGVALAFAASFLVGLSGAVSPGPLLALSIREAGRSGFLAGPSIALGHAALEFLVVLLLALGAAPVLRQGWVVASVAIAGGVFLLWMAWGMLRNPGSGAPEFGSPHQTATRFLGYPIFAGALVSLSNPFWFVWWMTVGAALLLSSAVLGPAGIGAFYVGHILADFAWYSLVTLAVATGRRLLTLPLYKGLMVACGLFLAGMGVYFMVSGVLTLQGYL